MDGSINDMITITVENEHWIERPKSAALLVINTLFLPLQSYEPIKSNDPLSLRQIAREGKLSELKNF